MNQARIQQLLHAPMQRHYRVKVGDTVSVELPRIPFTRETEFLRLQTSTRGDSVQASAAGSSGEGRLHPGAIVGKAVRPGTTHVRVTAYDDLQGREMDVAPLDIVIEVDA